jgi:hypothetical protein
MDKTVKPRGLSPRYFTYTEALDCSVEISLGTYIGEAGVKVKAYTNDTDAHGENVASKAVQKAADEFFGVHNYKCGVSMPTERSVAITIVPPVEG